jgi:hypothetical protein
VATHRASTASPLKIWTALSGLLAARRSMRVWRGPEHGYDKAGTLATVTLPVLPAALPLFDKRGRTNVLGLDFDAKHHGSRQVVADVADATALIEGAGGRVIVDRSTSGGMHVWVPLWSEATHTAASLRPLLDALATRWPTLDITPMAGPSKGCLTGPGSACKEGGHRQLIGPLADAVDAATTRSRMGTLGRIKTALAAGAILPDAIGVDQDILSPGVSSRVALPPLAQPDEPAAFSARRPLPDTALAFAVNGVVPGRRTPQGAPWSRSEARAHVLSWAYRRAWTLDQVHAEMTEGRWPGMVDAYRRYRVPDKALAADWRATEKWASAASCRNVRVSPHKQTHTGGGGAVGLRTWLASSLRWIELSTHLEGQSRWTVAAILQAMAYGAQLTDGTTVACGRRFYSIAGGLLEDRTVSETLRKLREVPGSPVLLVESHSGPRGDGYALVPPRIGGDPVEVGVEVIERTVIEPVAAVWKVLGLCLRRAFDVLDRAGVGERVRVADLVDATGQSRTQTYEAIGRLIEYGLVERGRGWVRRTTRTLDQVATEHQADDLVAARIDRYRGERRAWRELLALWAGEITQDCPDDERLPTDPLPVDDRAAWFAAVIAGGPPDAELAAPARR